MRWFGIQTFFPASGSTGQSRRSVTFLEDQRGGPGSAQLYQHYRPIEPAAPAETILVKWLEAEGPFYDPKTLFERLVDTHRVATSSDAELDEIADEFLLSFAQGAFRGRDVSEELVDHPSPLGRIDFA